MGFFRIILFGESQGHQARSPLNQVNQPFLSNGQNIFQKPHSDQEDSHDPQKMETGNLWVFSFDRDGRRPCSRSRMMRSVVEIP